jgi:hypothetical protein
VSKRARAGENEEVELHGHTREMKESAEDVWPQQQPPPPHTQHIIYLHFWRRFPIDYEMKLMS